MIKQSEKGQVIILMLLVMVIALAIALSLITRSNTEVSTSRKSEDSSRAFSAAEASIERAVNVNTPLLGSGTTSVGDISFGNQAGASVLSVGLPTNGKAMEYPPFGKEGFAQFWLANPTTLLQTYGNSNFDLYFGDPKSYPVEDGDRPGIEATVLTQNAGVYKSYQYYFDSVSGSLGQIITNGRSNGFYRCNSRCTDGNPPTVCPEVLTNNNTINTKFYCKVSIPGGFPGYSGTPIMVRVRILFSNTAQRVALMTTTTPVANQYLPKQFNLYTATGTSGNVRRTLEVFQQKSVMPQIFDFVLFSAQGLKKQ